MSQALAKGGLTLYHTIPTSLRERHFENIVGKEENAGNQQFLLFPVPTMFSAHPTMFSAFPTMFSAHPTMFSAFPTMFSAPHKTYFNF